MTLDDQRKTLRADLRAAADVLRGRHVASGVRVRPGVLPGTAIREMPAAPGLPVVISSGYVTEALKTQAQAAGVRAVLFKEYAFERLGGIVHAILDSRPKAPVPLQ